MGLLDLVNNTKAPTVFRTVRQKCHDYEGAYAYFQDRIAESKSKKVWPWVKQDADGDWIIRITLHSMPLYWMVEPVKDAPDTEIKDPAGRVIEMRPKVIGHTAYKVKSEIEGVQLLHALAKTEDADFKRLLTNAAEALKDVDSVELPNINAKAKADYDESAWAKSLGEWDVKDEEGKNGNIYSKDKTNKMNQFKQLARRQLGYERAKVVVTVSK